MEDKKYIISIDLGTTGNRVFCFDERGKVLSNVYREFPQYFPKSGWVEHDALEIWDSIKILIPEAIKKGNLNPESAIAIGITNQRETTLLWDSSTGKPIHKAIVWQCRRTSDICNQLKSLGYENKFREKTGLVIDAYFSGTKIKWLFDNVLEARTLAKNDRLKFGTIDTWILWNLTGGKVHATDFTNASRTLIFDIKQKKWSDELCDILGIPMNILPEVYPSAYNYGTTLGFPGLPDGIPIGGMAGDQQAAMVGQNCVFPGGTKNTYGTGCFMLLNNGEDFIISSNGLLTTLTPDNYGNPIYALEGSVFIGGAVMQWLRDYMKFFDNATESEGMANSQFNKEDEVVFVPAFVGLGAPYWKMDARGAIFGLTRDTTREQIVRAALKSIAFQSMDVIHAMEQDTGKKIHELRVDGGATSNRFLMQFQSDILGVPVLIPENRESTALGAAYLAGVATGVFKSIDEIASENKVCVRFEPVMNKQERDKQIDLWKSAIERLL
ncbi:MAG TPA: glycerol kinase GlpK [Spirochaetota bacterium]|nr:glycerol kinase GlpK [Spirochaetota bacterium]